MTSSTINGRVTFAKVTPVWMQVVEALRDRINDGTFPPGQPIPSESQLTGEFGVARGTARKAVARLRAEGLVYTVPRLGTFTTPHDQR